MMRLSRLVTGIVVGCAAVAMSALPIAAGQMSQAPPSAAAAQAKPQTLAWPPTWPPSVRP